MVSTQDNISWRVGQFSDGKMGQFSDEINSVAVWELEFKGFRWSRTTFVANWVSPDGSIFLQKAFKTKFGNNKKAETKLELPDSLTSSKEGVWCLQIYQNNKLLDQRHFYVVSSITNEKILLVKRGTIVKEDDTFVLNKAWNRLPCVSLRDELNKEVLQYIENGLNEGTLKLIHDIKYFDIIKFPKKINKKRVFYPAYAEWARKKGLIRNVEETTLSNSNIQTGILKGNPNASAWGFAGEKEILYNPITGDEFGYTLYNNYSSFCPPCPTPDKGPGFIPIEEQNIEILYFAQNEYCKYGYPSKSFIKKANGKYSLYLSYHYAGEDTEGEGTQLIEIEKYNPITGDVIKRIFVTEYLEPFARVRERLPRKPSFILSYFGKDSSGKDIWKKTAAFVYVGGRLTVIIKYNPNKNDSDGKPLTTYKIWFDSAGQPNYCEKCE